MENYHIRYFRISSFSEHILIGQKSNFSKKWRNLAACLNEAIETWTCSSWNVPSCQYWCWMALNTLFLISPVRFRFVEHEWKWNSSTLVALKTSEYNFSRWVEPACAVGIFLEGLLIKRYKLDVVSGAKLSFVTPFMTYLLLPPLSGTKSNQIKSNFICHIHMVSRC